MTAFNCFSHGTQDLYPSAFLSKQHGFSSSTVSTIAIVYNVGAMCGGIFFGSLSQRIGRRLTIAIASLLSIAVIPLWAFGGTALTIGFGAFLMQFFVQGAWGVIPAHLNEMSPPDARATFPGTVYQLGNFIASYNLVLQTKIAADHGENYSMALASVAIGAAIVIAVLTLMGREAREIDLNAVAAAPA